VRGIDTNVPLRVLTGDDPNQSPRAIRLLADAEARGERFHVSTTVLCELVWALRGTAYRRRREAIVQALEALLASSLFEVEQRDLVRRALNDYRDGPGDFADYLIGWQDDAAGCAGTLTFDRGLEGCERFIVLSGK
jgi:predicted nucleic-acid-binding protein